MTTLKLNFAHLALFSIFFLMFFTGGHPGIINADTADILHQARGLAVSDWHSPAAVFAISFLIPISRTPQNVLFFQSLACAAFFVVLIATVSHPSDAMVTRNARFLRALTAALLVVFGLSLFAMQCFVIKDTWIAIAYMGLVAALLCERGARRNPALSIVLILIPSLIRPTSFVATIPFAFYLLKGGLANDIPVLSEWFQLKTRKAALWAISIATIVCLATVPLVLVVDKVLIGATSMHPELSLQLFDLAGISAKTGEDQFAAEGLIPAGKQQPSVVSCYEPTSSDNYIWGACRWVSVELDARVSVASGRLFKAWIHAIMTHPVAYVMHRFDYAKVLLDRHAAIDYFAYRSQIVPAELREENDSWTPRLPIFVAVRILQLVYKGGIGFPVVWILADLLCAGIIVARRRRNAGALRNPIDDAIVACALSSLLSLATFAGLGPACELRYLYWSFISSFIAVLLFAGRSRFQSCMT